MKEAVNVRNLTTVHTPKLESSNLFHACQSQVGFITTTLSQEAELFTILLCKSDQSLSLLRISTNGLTKLRDNLQVTHACKNMGPKYTKIVTMDVQIDVGLACR